MGILPKRGRGRPRVNLPYEAAREIVRAEMLKSSVEYRKWWMANIPSIIPKNPNRAYAKTWKGWGDFLGTNNPFPCVRKSFRPYKQARAYAHKLGYTSKMQWFAHCKSPEFPIDIPKRPDIYYQKTRDWLTWKDFMGVTVASRTAALGETDNIIYVIKYPQLPSNVYTLGITDEGKAGLIQRRDQHGFEIIAGYYHDKQSDWMGKLAQVIRPYHVGERNYMVYNIVDVLSILSADYLVVR